MIKVYFANVPRFPEGGKLTQHLDKLRIGDRSSEGPLGEYIFNTAGPLCELVERRSARDVHAHARRQGQQFDTIGFIAGGSGITPVLQTARALLEDTTVKGIKVSILYANRTDAGILCHDTLKQIDELPNVRLVHARPAAHNWSYSSGFIDEAMVRNHLPAPGPKTYIFCCGPPPMINFACKPNLEGRPRREQRALLLSALCVMCDVWGCGTRGVMMSIECVRVWSRAGNDVLRTECVEGVCVSCVSSGELASCSGGVEGCSANKILSGPRIKTGNTELFMRIHPFAETIMKGLNECRDSSLIEPTRSRKPLADARWILLRVWRGRPRWTWSQWRRRPSVRPPKPPISITQLSLLLTTSASLSRPQVL